MDLHKCKYFLINLNQKNEYISLNNIVKIYKNIFLAKTKSETVSGNNDARCAVIITPVSLKLRSDGAEEAVIPASDTK